MNELKEMLESKVGAVTDEEITENCYPAAFKLAWIVSREGTSDGQRFSMNYFASLLAEQILASRFTKECVEKRKEAHRKCECTSKPQFNSITVLAVNQ